MCLRIDGSVGHDLAGLNVFLLSVCASASPSPRRILPPNTIRFVPTLTCPVLVFLTLPA